MFLLLFKIFYLYHFSDSSSFVFSTPTILFLFLSILHSSALDDYPSSNHRLQKLSIYNIISFISIIPPCCVSLSETCALLGYAFFFKLKEPPTKEKRSLLTKVPFRLTNMADALIIWSLPERQTRQNGGVISTFTDYIESLREWWGRKFMCCRRRRQIGRMCWVLFFYFLFGLLCLNNNALNVLIFSQIAIILWSDDLVIMTLIRMYVEVVP